MTYARYMPVPPLNAYIEHLYYLDGPAPYPRQKVLPMISINAMINLGNPFQVYEPDQVNPFMTCTESWWVGLWNKYHIVDWPSHVRFFRSIDSAQRIDWTQIALQTGYYDQPHFNKEFLAFTGHNPGDYLGLRHRVQSENPEYARNNGPIPVD